MSRRVELAVSALVGCSGISLDTGRSYVKLEFSQLLVFGAVDALTLVDGEGDYSLVVFDGGKSSLLYTWNRGVSRHD